MSNEAYVKRLVTEEKRIDGRPFDKFREVSVETGVVKTAEGSARVRIGKTHVLVGVKLDAREPFPDTPDEGTLMVDAELVPIGSPDFESGPPSERAIEISRVVDRGIRESKCIQMEKLCIAPGELVWSINIDAHILDYDGNIIDAVSLGAIAALLNARFPKFDEKEKKIIREEKTDKKLPVVDTPVEVTIGKISNKLLVDPSLEEDKALEARLTIATTKKNDICAMQKGGKGFFTSDEVEQAVDMAMEKCKDLRALLKA